MHPLSLQEISLCKLTTPIDYNELKQKGVSSLI